MDLATLIGLRPVPCAGLLVVITQRCPLRCAHCSSSSTMMGEQPDPSQVLRFVASFDPHDRPDVVMMTGGEPLLRPRLVAGLAQTARRSGSRVALLTGAFFAGNDRVPAPVWRAIQAVDHFSVSIDVFHERLVRRADVFRLLRAVLDIGTPVSVHAVGSGPDDPYLADLTAEVMRVFGDEVPMLVNTVRPVGRAAAWVAARDVALDPERVLPCPIAAWPVVAHDGVVVACGHQDTVDRRPVPEHLLLGHVGADDWATVRTRALASPVLRMIRAVGPVHLLSRFSRGAGASPSPAGYCDSCTRLGEHPDVIEAVNAVASGVVGELLDRHAARVQAQAGPVAFVRRHGCARYADLVKPAPGTRTNDDTEAA